MLLRDIRKQAESGKSCSFTRRELTKIVFDSQSLCRLLPLSLYVLLLVLDAKLSGSWHDSLFVFLLLNLAIVLPKVTFMFLRSLCK